jgi:SAM-dependent methyltransferase
VTVSDSGRAKALIAASYERSASDFAQFADTLVYRHLAAPLAARLEGTAGTILDVASGTGALARLLERPVASDISHGQLVHNPVELRVVADAEGLPFRARTFAAAVCAFGINHFPDARAAVSEMARVGSVVGLTTWVRPEAPYAPKEIVLDLVARHAGRSRTDAGDLVDELTKATGSVVAIETLLEGAGLSAEVREIAVEVPWPGSAQFVDYRMSTTGVTSMLDDHDAVRREAIAAVDALPHAELAWSPRLVVGIGSPIA